MNTEKPEWFHSDSITEIFDAREILKSGQHPLAEVIKRTSELQYGQIFELVTPFAPMPLIEKVNANGFKSFVLNTSDIEVHTFFIKK